MLFSAAADKTTGNEEINERIDRRGLDLSSVLQAAECVYCSDRFIVA